MMRNLIAQTAEGIPLGNKPLTGPGTIGDAVNTALDTNVNGVEGGGVVDVFSRQFSNIIGLITIIAGIFLIVNFLIAGFDWVQAGGDSGRVEKARTRMVNSALGLLVMILSFGIIGVIGGVFGLELLNPGSVFLNLVQTTGTGN